MPQFSAGARFRAGLIACGSDALDGGVCGVSSALRPTVDRGLVSGRVFDLD